MASPPSWLQQPNHVCDPSQLASSPRQKRTSGSWLRNHRHPGRHRARWNVSATNYSAPHGVTGCRPSREHRGTGNPRADCRRVYQAQPARERAGLRAEEAPRSRAEGVAAPAGGARRTRHVARLAHGSCSGHPPPSLRTSLNAAIEDVHLQCCGELWALARVNMNGTENRARRPMTTFPVLWPPAHHRRLRVRAKACRACLR